ncbi:hypothetical protein [Oceanithermus sp.]|uniref:hypothetical protein n=1 Tax=Oceanithermus sp. TaxID=2268145 RepID=UPI0025F6B081|nr:hypothetical protein [Oceanithermus sp.]
MKKYVLAGLFALTATLLVLTGCSNFSYSNPIGVPTVTLSIGDRSLTQDTNTGLWTLSFSLNAYTLPGSPAGVVNSFALQNGGSLSAGLRVESCGQEVATDCGPFTVNYSFQFAGYPPEGSYVITAFTVTGQNGTVYQQPLAEPLVIH